MRFPGSFISSRIAGGVVLAALGGCLLSGPAVGQERPARAGPPDSIRVHGIVVDRSTGRQLPAVEVRFTSLDLLHPATWRGLTEASGRFRTVNLPGGLYRVTLDALGFTSLQGDPAHRGFGDGPPHRAGTRCPGAGTRGGDHPSAYPARAVGL